MKKKVLVLNPYIATLGGGEKHMGYVCQFMEQYYKHDIVIDILVFNYNEVNVYAEDYITVSDLNRQFGIDLKCTNLRKISLPEEHGFVEHIKISRIVENISKEYDIFINFMFMSRHLGKAKVNIYEVMFPPQKYGVAYKNNMIKYMIATMIDHMFLNSYDYFVCNSRYTKKWLEIYWRKRKNACVVYPPVFFESEIDGRYDENKKENIIISVGRFFVDAHSKKQLEMVRFFVKHQEVFSTYEYHLCGAVSNLKSDLEYLEQVKEEASKVDNVYVHENCPFDRLLELYGKVKIFWHGTGYLCDEEKEPEKMEHFGITTVEAMSFGVVPVVIRRGGQTETVGEGVNGFLWESEDECVKNTKRLVDDDLLRKKMAKISVERSKLYSIENFYEGHKRLLDAIS